jgi:hypothetical protein
MKDFSKMSMAEIEEEIKNNRDLLSFITEKIGMISMSLTSIKNTIKAANKEPITEDQMVVKVKKSYTKGASGKLLNVISRDPINGITKHDIMLTLIKENVYSDYKKASAGITSLLTKLKKDGKIINNGQNTPWKIIIKNT